ncbi:glycoside hydrolase family 65 protein [Rugosimonospora africana]|uniref:Glycoside hydrolase family 65 central catalytic domain-containing protein n=1 Tax=Rugosimonospora africana TaxID=556532 RepID=A0A8J3QVR2_9ACTN|nr:glycoside hydrolase family 65 protein [Rugosimonospora africana]GIH15666.1 hypothetical protein Raf01_38380 [Rugosimonospora africana]
MSSPISPDPVTEWRPEYLPAYLSNGLIGLRIGHIPLLSGVMMVSGFEGLDPESRVEAFARAPYPLAGNLRVGRARLSDPGRAVLKEQRYDFSCGELHTRLGFEGDGVRADLDVINLCSRTQPTITLQEVKVTVDHDCEVTMTSGVNARDVPGGWAHNDPGALDTDMSWPDGPYYWESFGKLSNLGIAVRTQLCGVDQFDRQFDPSGPDQIVTHYTFEARAGVPYRVRRYVSAVPKPMHSQSHLEAQRLLEAAYLRGFDSLRADNHAAWDWLWQGRVVLEGAPARWQAFADAAFYYLHSSVNGSSPSSSSVFGLAYWPNYHYYRGHQMWDLETFALPPLLLTQPEAAAGLLRFRKERLPAAIESSRVAGYRGAKYPWESSLRDGSEATPTGTFGAATEHHVSTDVAIAFARYVHATGDLDFATREAWPVMTAVAEWIESRSRWSTRGFEIQQVIGIAETGHLVNNSAFVNMSAAVALRETIAMAHLLNLPVPPQWEEMADQLVIPSDPRTRVIQNHDDYDPSEEQGATPEAPAGLFPLCYEAGTNTERRTFEYYLNFADQYAGQPMLSAMLGVYAARLGDRARALELFEKGYGQFVVDPYTITLEYSPTVFPDHPHAGPFTANLGGFLTSCLYGLTGLQLREGEPAAWFDRQITLPDGWDAIHVDRLWAHTKPMSLHAVQGDDRGHLVPSRMNAPRD